MSRRLEALDYQMNALVTLTMAALTAADAPKLTSLVSQIDDLARHSQKPEFQRIAYYLTGYSKYYTSDLDAAFSDLDQAVLDSPPGRPGSSISFDQTASVRMIRSRALWARGEFQASLEEMDEALHSALMANHPPTLAWIAWGGGVCVYLWAGAMERAVTCAKLFEELAREHSNPGWATYIPSMQHALERLQNGGRSFSAESIKWEPTAPSHVDIMTSIHCAFHRPVDVKRIEKTPQHWCAAEHFRAAGEHELAAGRRTVAEKHFSHALSVALTQGAVAWEVRAAVSLARLKLQEDQRARARALLEPVVDRFPDGKVNADLTYARNLLVGC